MLALLLLPSTTTALLLHHCFTSPAGNATLSIQNPTKASTSVLLYHRPYGSTLQYDIDELDFLSMYKPGFALCTPERKQRDDCDGPVGSIEYHSWKLVQHRMWYEDWKYNADYSKVLGEDESVKWVVGGVFQAERWCVVVWQNSTELAMVGARHPSVEVKERHEHAWLGVSEHLKLRWLRWELFLMSTVLAKYLIVGKREVSGHSVWDTRSHSVQGLVLLIVCLASIVVDTISTYTYTRANSGCTLTFWDRLFFVGPDFLTNYLWWHILLLSLHIVPTDDTLYKNSMKTHEGIKKRLSLGFLEYWLFICVWWFFFLMHFALTYRQMTIEDRLLTLTDLNSIGPMNLALGLRYSLRLMCFGSMLSFIDRCQCISSLVSKENPSVLIDKAFVWCVGYYTFSFIRRLQLFKYGAADQSWFKYVFMFGEIQKVVGDPTYYLFPYSVYTLVMDQSVVAVLALFVLFVSSERFLRLRHDVQGKMVLMYSV